MNKTNGIISLGILLAAGVGYYMLFKCKREGAEGFTSSFERAGRPDQIPRQDAKDIAELENAKMVSEGSQFGVQYYNKTSKEEREMLEQDKS